MQQNTALEANPEASTYLEKDSGQSSVLILQCEPPRKKSLTTLSKQILLGEVTIKNVILIDAFEATSVFRNQESIVKAFLSNSQSTHLKQVFLSLLFYIPSPYHSIEQ